VTRPFDVLSVYKVLHTLHDFALIKRCIVKKGLIDVINAQKVTRPNQIFENIKANVKGSCLTQKAVAGKEDTEL
jgi:predicted DNA-binding transcriptional regulator